MKTRPREKRQTAQRTSTTLQRAEVLLGRVAGVFGVRGELKIAATRVGEDALRTGLAVALRSGDAGEGTNAILASVRRHKSHVLVTLEGVDRAESAEGLVGAQIWTSRDNVRLGAGEYYDEDLLGCRVVQRGRSLGKVLSVQHYPAQDVLELDGGSMVPMVSAFVRRIDVVARTIDVELPEGLVEGEPL